MEKLMKVALVMIATCLLSTPQLSFAQSDGGTKQAIQQLRQTQKQEKQALQKKHKAERTELQKRHAAERKRLHASVREERAARKAERAARNADKVKPRETDRYRGGY